MAYTLVLAVIMLAGALPAAAGAPEHGIAMHGEPALAKGFRHFPYVNPTAPRGGRLKLGAAGSFDSLNPFVIKGVVPDGVRDYVFESLLVRSADEPFSLYGLIAERFEVPDDRGSVTFHLHAAARFSDGRPITPEDVLFSYEVLREKGWPYHRSHYRKVARAERVEPNGVRFVFAAEGDREIPLIMGLLPILPRHGYTADSFERTTLEPPIGSGPYVIAEVDPGRGLIYRRNPNHWAKDHPAYRGRYNFDEISISYFRDTSTLFEAFKAGEIDARVEDDPTRWSEGYAFPAALDGRVVKGEFASGLPAGLSALVFNTRRPLFADARVRQALLLLFDFEWLNRNLYDGLYSRTESVFARSELAAVGRPADERERALLAPYLSDLPADLMEGRARLPRSDGAGTNRDNMRRAHDLLRAAGYALEGSTLVEAATGKPFMFEVLIRNRGQERLVSSFSTMLARLGIRVAIRQVDDAQYWARLRAFDFDMIQWHWPSSLSPGNEQQNRWSSRAAVTEGALNYAAVKSAAVDASIAALLAARSREDFTSAVRALDRAVMAGTYVIPLFHLPKQWIAHWAHLGQPAPPPLSGTSFDLWWDKSAK